MMRNERLEPRAQGAIEVARSPGVAACGHGILLDVVLGQQSGSFFHIQVMGFKEVRYIKTPGHIYPMPSSRMSGCKRIEVIRFAVNPPQAIGHTVHFCFVLQPQYGIVNEMRLAIGERFVVEKQFREGIGGFSFCSLSHVKRR